jgi:hypothetical protein
VRQCRTTNIQRGVIYYLFNFFLLWKDNIVTTLKDADWQQVTIQEFREEVTGEPEGRTKRGIRRRLLESY